MDHLPDPQTLLPLVWTIVPIAYVLLMIPVVLLDILVHRALVRCAPASRTMAPGLVWLGLIPVLSFFWPFKVVNAVATSLHNEFVRRGIAESPAPGRAVGMAWAWLSLLSFVPVVNFLTILPAEICWAIYCIQVALFTRKLDDNAAMIPA